MVQSLLKHPLLETELSTNVLMGSVFKAHQSESVVLTVSGPAAHLPASVSMFDSHILGVIIVTSSQYGLHTTEHGLHIAE